MRVLSAFAFALSCACDLVRADDHIVMPPKITDKSLPEKMLVFVPGGDVPNTNYMATADAIQAATTKMRLWVVIPAVFQRLCIITCSAPNELCAPFHKTVENALSLAQKQGWQRGKDSEDLWLGGHSLGGVCANTLFRLTSKNGTAEPGFAGLIEMGSYVDKDGDFSVANYPVPVMTLNGELDFGGARPTKTGIWWKQHMHFAEQTSENEALRQKPVIVLRGLNHSVFCPGFDVPGDLPAEVTQQQATKKISAAVASFLHAQGGDAQALAHLAGLKAESEPLMIPFLKAEALEQKDGASPFCEWASHTQAGLSKADDAKFVVKDTFFDKSGDVEDCHTKYEVVGGQLHATSCSHTAQYADIHNTGSHGGSKSIWCKMISSDRAAQQLNTTAESPHLTCREINQQTIAMVEAFAEKKTLSRFKSQGRGWCFEEDIPTFENIGPLWLYGSMNFTETAECLSVASLAEHTEVDGKIYPGNSYCKLLSPTRVLDWMMTDSLKPFTPDAVSVVV